MTSTWYKKCVKCDKGMNIHFDTIYSCTECRSILCGNCFVNEKCCKRIPKITCKRCGKKNYTSFDIHTCVCCNTQVCCGCMLTCSVQECGPFCDDCVTITECDCGEEFCDNCSDPQQELIWSCETCGRVICHFCSEGHVCKKKDIMENNKFLRNIIRRNIKKKFFS
jgi:hypothetical protein